MVFNYLQFLKIYENNNNNDIDPYGEENWDEVDSDEDRISVEYVMTNNNIEIPIDDAIWCEYGEFYCYYEDATWSEYNGIHFLIGDPDFIWVDSINSYVHIDDVVCSEEECYLSSDAIWCEYDNDYCLFNDAIQLDDGKYAIKSNTTKINGKVYHNSELKWDKEKDEYIK